MKSTQYTACLLVVLVLLACGGTERTTHYIYVDGDGAEESALDADGDAEPIEVEPGTECEAGISACKDPYTLYTCTNGVWALAATCTDDGRQCVGDVCKAPSDACENMSLRCNGQYYERCENGVWKLRQDCKTTPAVTCSARICSDGTTDYGCYDDDEKCHH